MSHSMLQPSIRMSHALLALFLLWPGMVVSQESTILWSPSGAELPQPTQFVSSVNFDGNVVNVGGCMDSACTEVTPHMSTFDIGTQNVLPMSRALPHGIAGAYSSVAVASRDEAARTALFVFRSCSLCFLVNGVFQPCSAVGHAPTPIDFFSTIVEVGVNASAPRNTPQRYWVNQSALAVPLDHMRCNASCIANGPSVFIVGGVSIATGDEMRTVDVYDISTASFRPNVTEIPADLFQLRRMGHNASGDRENVMGGSFVCSFGSTSPIGVSSNNAALFLSLSCWDNAYGDTSTFVTLLAFYPNQPALSGGMSLLFANVSLPSGTQPKSSTFAVLPFASQIICTGGALEVGVDFIFTDFGEQPPPLPSSPFGHRAYIGMSATQESGHASLTGEILLGPTGAQWNLYSFGGLDSSTAAPTGVIQIGPTAIGIPAPLDIVVSAAWTAGGLSDNTTYSQSSFGSVVILQGQNVTVRMTELSPTELLMLSPWSDCSEPLPGTVAVTLNAYEVTFHVTFVAMELYLCLSDGVQVLAGFQEATGAPVLVRYFSPCNALFPMTVLPLPAPTTTTTTTTTTAAPIPSTTVPPSASLGPTPSVAPVPTQTTTAPWTTPAPVQHPSSLPKWLPLWALIVGSLGIVLLVAVVVICVVVLCRRYGARRNPRVSQRDLIALENITNSNKYTVVRRLGSGGNGEVFLVKRKKDGELCAIKHVRCVGSKTRDDLFRESDTLDRLKGHPNMVEILEMSLHEVYIAEDDLDEEDLDSGEDTDVYAVSEKTDLNPSGRINTKQSNASTNRRRRRRSQRTGESFLGQESIASTGPMGSDRLAALNASLIASQRPPLDADTERFAGAGITTGSDAETPGTKAFLNVRRRKMRGHRKSNESFGPGDDITVISSGSRAFRDDSGEDHAAQRGGSELSSGVEGDSGRSKRLIVDGGSHLPTRAGPAKRSDSEVSASSYYQSINGDEGHRTSSGGRRVRFQCIVMKYFKKGDLATFIELQLPFANSFRSQGGERRGSLFAQLMRSKRSESRDDMSSVNGRSRYAGGGGGGVGYESDKASAPRKLLLSKSPGPEERLDVPVVGGGGSDSDDPSATSRNPSDDERNVAPTAEPRIAKVRRIGSTGNFSQSSQGGGWSMDPGSAGRPSSYHAAPPLREDVVASIIYQVAALLRYLHSRKPNRIVHCDIKPENILVADTIHPLYLQLLGGHAANAMHAANTSGRTPSRLFARYLTNGVGVGVGQTTAYGGTNPVSPGSEKAGRSSTQASKRTLARGHDGHSSPYFIGQSQKSSLPSTPLTVGGQVTAVGETIASALEDVFLPIVVSDVGQAMEVPWEPEGNLPPVCPPAPGQLPRSAPQPTAAPSVSIAAASSIRLIQCTMPYVAPECIASGLRCVSPAIDVWALGCVVYSVCTKKLKHTDVVVMFEEVRKPTFAEDIRFELCEVLGYSNALASLVLAMLNTAPAQRPTAADITNHWMTFVPHNGQEILPGVMKIQVTVPSGGTRRTAGPTV